MSRGGAGGIPVEERLAGRCRLVQSLAQWVRAEPLREGWLLAPSGRAGRQWLDQVAQSGVAVASVRPLTVRNLILDLARPELVRRERRFLNSIGQVVVMDGILRTGVREMKRGLGVEEITPGLTEALARSLDELRCAGVEAGVVWAGFPDSYRDKHGFLGRLQARYGEALEARGLVDYGAVLEMARGRLRSGEESLKRVTLLQPDDLEIQVQEAELLALWPGPRVILRTDQPADEGEPATARTALEALRWMGMEGVDQSAVLSGEGDEPTVWIVAAECEEREIEGVLRECVRRGYALDEVELLHTDEDTYLRRIHGVLARMYGGEDGEPLDRKEDLPLTCAEGIPCDWTRPGRALRAWVAWLREGASGEGLARLVADGLVVLPEDWRGELHVNRVAAAIRALRLAPKLAGAMERLDRMESREGESSEGRRGVISLAMVGPLRALFEGILACGFELETSSAEVLKRAICFLETLAGALTERDRRARKVLIGRLRDAQEWLETADGSGGLEVWRWLDRLAREARVDGSGPEPGCLHVARVDRGGHTGRRFTAIVGLCEDRFPLSGGIDPILTDAERRGFGGALKCGMDRPAEQRAAFTRLLARLRGVLWVSYPVRTMSDGREQLPSTVVEEMLRCLGRARAEVDESATDLTTALDARDWWRASIAHGMGRAVELGVLERHAPNLMAGRHAAEERGSERFTEYDGWVPEAGLALDPTQAGNPAPSVTMLEALGTCPRRYFYRHVLELKRPDLMRGREDEWLDAAESGELLHVVLREYVNECMEQNEGVLRREGLPRLLEILERHAEDWRRRTLVPSEAAFQRRMRELRRAMRIFLVEEEYEQARSGARPALLEYALGEKERPIPVPVAGLGSIPLHGKADRVDRIETPAGTRYRIVDYKSGRDRDYKAGDAFQGGRYLQPFLYLELLAIRLREGMERGVDVAGFGYFFPGVKGAGSRLSWERDEQFVAEGRRILSRLIRLLRAGAFPATDKVDDCGYCDFRLVCEPVKELADQSRAKLDHAANEMIAPYAELRAKRKSPGGGGA